MGLVEVFILQVKFPTQYLPGQCDVEVRQVHVVGVLQCPGSTPRGSWDGLLTVLGGCDAPGSMSVCPSLCKLIEGQS